MIILPSHHYQFSALLTAISSLLLVVLVYQKGVDKRLKRQFTFYYASLFLWSLSVFICTSVYNYQVSYLFNQMTHIAAIMIPVFFLHFTLVYLGRLKSISEKFMMTLFYSIALFFEVIVIFFRQFFFLDIEPKFSFPFFPTAGRVYTPWVITFSIAVVTAHAVLFRELLRSKGIRRKQISFFLIANLLGYFGGIGCFLPVYDLPYFPFPYGPYGVFLLSLVSGYTILKHRFIDLEILVKRTIVFGSLFGSIFALFSFVLLIFQRALFTYMSSNPFLPTAISILLIVLIYDPLRRSLVQLTDHFLFQEKVDYRKLLKEATEYLAHLDSLKKQARRIVAFLIYKARIANVSLYAFQSFAPGSVLLQASRPRIKAKGHKTIPFSHPIVGYMKSHRSSIQLRLIEEAKIAEKNHEKIKELDEIIQLFKDHQAEAVIPCFGSDASERARRSELHLRGILFLGHQKSDEPYTEEDLDVFFTLGQESSIAFENARLYDEAIQRSDELATINTKLEEAQTQILRALSETESTNKRLRETQSELIEAKKRALLAGLSSAVGHEIRNPLQPLLWNVYYILKHIKNAMALYETLAPKLTEAERERYLTTFSSLEKLFDVVQRSGERIKGVVSTLINLVKERSDQKGEVQLKLVFASALEEVRFQTYWETLTVPKIIEDIPSDLPFVRGITQDIQGVFVNLIINSLHAMEKTFDKQIKIKAAVDSDNPKMIRIDFSDNGSGIPKELHEKIFEHGFTTKGQKGTGIGLFYCKDNIERVHGGTISVRSEVGMGTCFTIRLPIYDGPESASGGEAVRGDISHH